MYPCVRTSRPKQCCYRPFVGARIFSGTDYGYTTTFYEASPRGVVNSTRKAGTEWNDADRRVSVRTLTNTSSGDYSCNEYYTTAESSSYLRIKRLYPDGTLTVEETIDEEDKRKLVFKDIRGLVVLTREGVTGDWNDTRYVYNDYGDLLWVIQPNQPVSGTVRKSRCFRYSYDSRGRCTFKALPECEGTSYYYDSRSRLFAEQDGNMKDEGRFLLHFYDRFGREALNVFSKATESAVKSAALRSYTAKRSGTVLNGPMAGYAIEGGITLTADELHSACYYDDYSFLTATNPMWPYTIRQGSFSSASNKIRGVLTGSKAGECLTALHYDDAGRTIRIAYGSATTRPVSTTLIRYDYEGNAVEEQNTASAVLESSSRIVKQTVNRSYYSSGHLMKETVIQNGDSAKTSYRYDSGGRVSQQTYSKDLKRKLIYNANGWLTSWKLTSTLNPNLIFPGLSTIDVAEPDLIKDPIITIKEYKLKSDTLHYGDGGTGYTARYDGKISGRKSGSDMTAYSYDNHGRLTQARTVSTASRDYSATYSYDRNANILSINRMGITDVVGTSNSYGTHNSVTLGYGSNSNRLSTISVSREGADYEGRTGLSPTGGTVTGFGYDANGNLTKDPSRDIVLIKYNHLNLPTDVYFGNGQRQTIEYYGNGVKKSVSYSQTTASIVGGNVPGDDQYTVTTERIYAGPHIFSDKHLEYSAFAGGYFEPEKGAYYYVRDWQGNNVGVVDSDGKMVESTTYYPYGEPTKEPAGQRFLYGGKEREHGGGRNSYDFSARNLIAPLGQWGVPDPKAEKYFSFSPYSYCGGDPINRIDDNGEDIYELNSEGKIINVKRNFGYDLISLMTPNGTLQEAIFEYGTIQTPKHIGKLNGKEIYFMEINGVENSEAIFMMLACNTNAEWSFIQAENKNTGELNNYVGTSQSNFMELSGVHIMTKVLSPDRYNLIRSVHSHPNNQIPSGFPKDQKSGEKRNGDIAVAELIQNLYPDFNTFELFRVKSLRIDIYSKDSLPADFVINPTIFYDIY